MEMATENTALTNTSITGNLTSLIAAASFLVYAITGAILKVPMQESITLSVSDSPTLLFCLYHSMGFPGLKWQNTFKNCYKEGKYSQDKKEKKFFELYEKGYPIHCVDDSTPISVSSDDIAMVVDGVFNESTTIYVLDLVTSITPNCYYIHTNEVFEPTDSLKQFEKKVIQMLSDENIKFDRPPVFVTAYYTNIMLTNDNIAQTFWVVKIDFESKSCILYSSKVYVGRNMSLNESEKFKKQYEAEKREFELVTEKLSSLKLERRFSEIAHNVSVWSEPEYWGESVHVVSQNKEEFDKYVRATVTQVACEVFAKDTFVITENDRVYEFFKQPFVLHIEESEAKILLQKDATASGETNKLVESNISPAGNTRSVSYYFNSNKDITSTNENNGADGTGQQERVQRKTETAMWYLQNIYVSRSDRSTHPYSFVGGNSAYKEDIPMPFLPQSFFSIVVHIFVSRAKCETKYFGTQPLSSYVFNKLVKHAKSQVDPAALHKTIFKSGKTGIPFNEENHHGINDRDIYNVSTSETLKQSINSAFGMPRIPYEIVLKNNLTTYRIPDNMMQQFVDISKVPHTIYCYDDHLSFSLSLHEIMDFFANRANLTLTEMNYAVACIYRENFVYTYIPLLETDATKQLKFFEDEVVRSILKDNFIHHTYITVLEHTPDTFYSMIRVTFKDQSYYMEVVNIKTELVFNIHKTLYNIQNRTQQEFFMPGAGSERDLIKVNVATLDEIKPNIALSKVVSNAGGLPITKEYDVYHDGTVVKWRVIKEVISLLKPLTLNDIVKQVQNKVLETFNIYGKCKVSPEM